MACREGGAGAGMNGPRTALLIDVLLALAAAGIAIANLTADAQGSADQEPDALGIALAIAMVAPILVRRRYALPVLAVTCGAWFTLGALDYPALFPLAPLIAIYTVGESRHIPARRAGAVVAVGALAAFAAIAIGANRPAGVEPEWIIGLAALGLSAWLVGDRLRARLDAMESQRRLAIAEDRTRVARELHDSVGHAVNTIAINAGAARVNLGGDPSAVRDALNSIEISARRTAAEMDAVLGGLRGSEDLPSAEQLPELVESQRAIGQSITESLSWEGADRATGRAAYRIVQEALTNASRHAPGEEVTLRVGPRGGQLYIEVANADPGGETNEGRGLRGVHERVAALGGTVSAGVQDGRFVLQAFLPLEEIE